MISEFPLFVFTLLGGMGAGAYVAAAFLPQRSGRARVALPALVLVLLAVSGVALLTHLGRPELVFNAFRNPTAGITLEGFATILFDVFVVIDVVLAATNKPANKVVGILAAVAGVLLLAAMGYAYASFDGVAVWGTWQTYLLFILGGIATGSALVTLFADDGFASGAFAVTVAVAAALAAVAEVLVGMVFAANGYSVAPFAIGAVALLGAAAVALVGRGRGKGAALPAVALALAFVGVAVARYFFYTVM